MNTSAHAAPPRAACPRGAARRVHQKSVTTATNARPLVNRWENSTSVSTEGDRGSTTPLQSGQWPPHPAPDPVARTYAPQRMTTMV